MRHDVRRSSNPTYCFVYRSVIRRCRRVTPSASRVAALMNGWSAGTIERFGSFLFWSFGGTRRRLYSGKHVQRKDQLTLGSATPRDCTRMTLCKNLTAANCTPACASGAHMNSMIRLFARESVSHSGRSVLLVHLSSKRTTSAFRGFPKCGWTHSRRKRSGYAPANVCTAILTVQVLSSFKRPASTSRDCTATRKKRGGE
jgi:hypothetical protein